MSGVIADTGVTVIAGIIAPLRGIPAIRGLVQLLHTSVLYIRT